LEPSKSYTAVVAAAAAAAYVVVGCSVCGRLWRAVAMNSAHQHCWRTTPHTSELLNHLKQRGFYQCGKTGYAAQQHGI
jgi:hypothetical protein